MAGLILAATAGDPIRAAEVESLVVSADPREIVFFVGTTSLVAGQTRSVTVYGDGTALLHVDTGKEVLEKATLKIDREELEALLKEAVANDLLVWSSEGLGRRAEALRFQLLGKESATRTWVLFALGSYSHEGGRTLSLADSRALAAAFPQIGEYSAVVRLEDWMESLWQRPSVGPAASVPQAPELVTPGGIDEVIGRIVSRPGDSLGGRTELIFFGDGAFRLESEQPLSPAFKCHGKRLTEAELAEVKAILKRLADFEERSISVQVFRKTGQTTFPFISNPVTYEFEIFLETPGGEKWTRHFTHEYHGSARYLPSIQEFGDLERIWKLALNACKR